MLNGWHTADFCLSFDHLTPKPDNKSLHLLSRTGRFFCLGLLEACAQIDAGRWEGVGAGFG
jgi:hypothetical protein